MKYILVLLVLANLGFFAWNYTQPLPEAETPAPRPLLNTGLTLVSEYEAETDALALDARRLCSQVSGFDDSQQAESFIELARGRGLEALLQVEPSAEPAQYRLYLPPTPTREIANLTLEDIADRLQAAELSIDTYLITRGELENAVALGVYEDRGTAEAVQTQILGLGYTPFIEEIAASTAEVQVWLRAPNSGRINDAEWLDLSAENGNLTRLENLCQTIAQASQFQ